MRIYGFGDIHGNEKALDVILRHIDTVKPDEVICLGDIVGWLPWGRKTLEVITKMGIPSVAGNHDLMVAGVFPDYKDQIDRMQATAYTAGTLAEFPQFLEYLESLPLVIEKETCVITHFSPFDLPEEGTSVSIENFTYLSEEKLGECIPKWKDFLVQVIITGHDHLPALYEFTENGQVKKHPIRAKDSVAESSSTFAGGIIEEKFVLNGSSKYWIKAGAVGGPYRDGVPMANSVLYDANEGVISFFRIPYDVWNVAESLRLNRLFRNIETIQRFVRTAYAWNKK